MGKQNWVNNALSIGKSSKGKLTVYVCKDVELKKGSYLIIKTYEEHLKHLVDKNVITAEQAEADWEKYGANKMYVVDVPPQDGNNGRG